MIILSERNDKQGNLSGKVKHGQSRLHAFADAGPGRVYQQRVLLYCFLNYFKQLNLKD